MTFNPDSVEKRILVQELPYAENPTKRVEFLCGMYLHARGCRGLVQVKSTPKLTKNSGDYKVTMKTMGFHKSPQDEGGLKSMAKDLVTGLARLHEKNYLHCDIRLPNIIYDPYGPTGPQYVLIDFEHAGQARGRCGVTKNAVNDTEWLKAWDIGMLDDGIYTKASEMYQLAKVLRQCLPLSQDGEDFVVRLEQKSMTVHESLQHVWISAV
jgi:serine/threonine protein kinase